MRKLIFFLVLVLTIQQNLFAQCNKGLNLGAVVVPTHGNSGNGGNFFNVTAWQEASKWIDTFNLDYRQRYLTWTDIVQQITNGIPTYNSYSGFENGLTMWAGNCNVHVIYPVIKVELPNTTMAAPAGFVSTVDSTHESYFSDTAFVNQNYLAIRHILQNVNNVRWISVGNEIDTYFKNAYWGTGRLTRYGAFLDSIRSRMNADGFSYVKLGSVVAFHNLTWLGNYDIIDSIRPHVDFVGYTLYYTTTGPASDTCWGNPATVTTWLNIAKAKAGTKKMMLTETCMGDGGGVEQNCGSPSKQLAYADTLLSWYNADTPAIEGMTWFTAVDPYLTWQTPNTLWNTCGLVDSNGMTVQPAGSLWRHQCMNTGLHEAICANNVTVYPNPFAAQVTLELNNPMVNATVNLYNSYGLLVKQISNFSGKSIILYRDNLPCGLYFVKLSASTRIITTTKLVISD